MLFAIKAAKTQVVEPHAMTLGLPLPVRPTFFFLFSLGGSFFSP